MYNTRISTNNIERGLNKLERVIGTKNLRRSETLSDNLLDKVSDHSDNLKGDVKKEDQNHTSVVINKHDIVASVVINKYDIVAMT